MRRRRGVKALALLVSVLICLAATELLVGYVTFLRSRGAPAFVMFGRRLCQYRYKLLPGSANREHRELLGKPVRTVCREDNPFVQYASRHWYKYHPFIDYSFVLGLYPELIPHDYFGFRNANDLYFERPTCRLVVMTGGSEAAGFSHKTSIAEYLEAILSQRSGERFRVLNLAMNSYAVAGEINAYVQLAYHLQPDVVITHSGWNDFLYGMMVPTSFTKLGLNYCIVLEYWLPRLHELKVYAGPDDWVFNEGGAAAVVDGYILALRKYRRIVEGNGGVFICGLQGYNPQILQAENLLYRRMPSLYEELLGKASREGLVDFTRVPGLEFVDSAHTTEASAQLTAEIYAERVLAALSML